MIKALLMNGEWYENIANFDQQYTIKHTWRQNPNNTIVIFS
jgi:hypothetical protein